MQEQQSAKQNWLHLHRQAKCTVEWSLSSIATLMIKQQLHTSAYWKMCFACFDPTVKPEQDRET